MRDSAAEIDPVALLPHGAAMVLIDAVLDFDDRRLVATSARHRRANHPLACDGVLASVHLLEYAAQAAAIHLGCTLAAVPVGAPPRPGVLAYVRELRLPCASLLASDPPVLIEVQQKARIPDGFAYAFTVCFEAAGEGHAVQTLASGVFGVLLARPDNVAMAG